MSNTNPNSKKAVPMKAKAVSKTDVLKDMDIDELMDYLQNRLRTEYTTDDYVEIEDGTVRNVFKLLLIHGALDKVLASDDMDVNYMTYVENIPDSEQIILNTIPKYVYDMDMADDGPCGCCDECDCCDDEEVEEEESKGSLDICLDSFTSLTAACSVMQQTLTMMLMEIANTQNRITKAIYDELHEDNSEAEE